jgi:hypothetical protein
MQQASVGSNFPASRKMLPNPAEMAEIGASRINHVRMTALTLGNSCRRGQELPPMARSSGRMCRVNEPGFARGFIELEFIFC